jgi:hypothetical protein
VYECARDGGQRDEASAKAEGKLFNSCGHIVSPWLIGQEGGGESVDKR